MGEAAYRNRRGAPAPGTVLCRADEIAPGDARVCTFGSGADLFEMFVLRPPDGVVLPQGAGAEGLVAYVNDCPHARSPLDWTPGRFLDRERRHIYCTTHGARFRIHDGLCVSGPCPGQRLTPVPIESVAGTIRIAAG